MTRLRKESCPIIRWIGRALLLGLVLSSFSGCKIKKTVKVEVADTSNDRSAGFDELLSVIKRYDRISELVGRDLELTLTVSRRSEPGLLDRYPKVSGYVLLKRPDAARLVLLTPLSKSTLFDILSVGDELTVWYPRENKYYQGSNSARELLVEDSGSSREFSIPIRGAHIFEAIFPQSIDLDSPGLRISMEEQSDAVARHYVLTVFQEAAGPRMNVVRRIWVERVGLTIARQQVFQEDGKVVSDITYSTPTTWDGFLLPLRIHVDRKLDGYVLDLKFKNWRVNPTLSEKSFELPPPPGAETVRLIDKRRPAGVSE